MDPEALKRLGEQFQAQAQERIGETEEEQLMRLRDLTPGQVRQFVVTAGKFRGKKFESLYEDKDYVKWILEHLNGKSKVMAFGMKQVLVLLELRMREDYKPTTKTVVKKGEPTSAGSARGGSPSGSSRPDMPGRRDDRRGDEPMGPHRAHGSDGDRPDRTAGGSAERQQAPRYDRSGSRHHHPAAPEAEGGVRSRSRSPRAGLNRPDADEVLYSGENSPETIFANFVGKLSVLELEVPIAPRDVHRSKGVWVVNQKAKKNIEVCLRKLNADERKQFEHAMTIETDSFMSTEAVRICERAGIPKERIMNMRFVLTWKTLSDEEGKAQGKKAKARLIVRGFEDPGLLEVSRESPTLSSMGRNLLLSECAQQGYRVCVCRRHSDCFSEGR